MKELLILFLLLTISLSSSLISYKSLYKSSSLSSLSLLYGNNKELSINDNEKLNAISIILSSLGVLSVGAKASIAVDVATVSTDTKSTSNTKNNMFPEITSKVYLDIKISNYTEESIGTNKGAKGSGRIVIGLFGKESPVSVKRFLDTVNGDGETRPSFYNSQFSKIINGNFLQIERVRGINAVNIAGTEQFEYKGNILSDYTPILEQNNIPHYRKGLLTRRQLTAGPEFGITLGPANELDAFHNVFGTVLEGDEVLDAIMKIPIYTYRTKTGYAGEQKGIESDLADKWFESQKEFYVKVGQAIGDTRAVDQRGKLLRRIVIKGAGKL
jgi:cyclophilin family peptidyl-prolyl cis-trans isomerase